MQTRHSRPHPLILTLIAATVALAGCGDEKGPIAPAPVPADVDTYVASLPAWSQFSPPLADADVAMGEGVGHDEDIGGEPNHCTSTPYSLTRTPDRIVTLNPDVEILWVGSLLQGRGHLGGIGALAELPIRERAPMTLSIDLLTSDNSRTVERPTVATVNSAIGELIQAAQDAGHVAGSNIFYTKETTHSLTQAALSMGLSASYMGASIKAALSANLSDENRTVTAYFVQRMFTVSMVLPQSPGAVFSEALSQATLQQQADLGRIGPENLPVYVSSIAYGRILMFSFTSTASIASINAAISAMYNSGEFGGELSTELRQVIETAQIEVVTVGGDAENALALIRANDLGAYFASDANLTTARPISYTVRNLGDNVIASVSETTEYTLQQCVPASLPITGEEYRIKFTKLYAEALPYIDPVIPILDSYDLELQYTIYIETLDGIDRVLHFESTLLNPYAARLREGNTFVLPNNERTIRIHFDGRDFVRVRGQIRDWDDTSAPDPLDVSYTYQYPPRPIQQGETFLRARDSSGNVVRIYYTLLKTGDLDN